MVRLSQVTQSLDSQLQGYEDTYQQTREQEKALYPKWNSSTQAWQ
jgi:hypothetical protein